MHKIFISYRRSDSQDITNRIYDRLRAIFGPENIFKDVDSIQGGVDFRTAIAQALDQCQVMIVVIGASWLNTSDRTGRPRLQNPGDFVRQEVEGALIRRGIQVYPLLVQGAAMPEARQLPPSLAQLAYQNARQVDSNTNFHHDMDRVIRDITQFVPPLAPSLPAAPVPALPGSAGGRLLSSGLLGLVGGGGGVALFLCPHSV